MERPASVSDRVLTSGRRLKMSLSSLKSIEIRETTAALRIQQFYRGYLRKVARPASSKKLKVTNDTLALTTAFLTSTMASTKPLHAREVALHPQIVVDEPAVQHVDMKATMKQVTAPMHELLVLRAEPYESDAVDNEHLVYDQFVNMMSEKWLLCSTTERMSVHKPMKETYVPFYASLCDVRPWFTDLIFVARGGPVAPYAKQVMTAPSSRAHLESVLAAITRLNAAEHWTSSATQLAGKVRKLFWTMRSEMMLPMVRSIGYILCKGWRLLFDGLYIDMASIEAIQQLVASLGPDTSLVFTPTHKSHLDYLLISFVCFAYGLPLPRIAAGNNLNLPLVGRYLRSNGSFFIRRSFQGDSLYKETLTAYVHALLADGAPLEVFVEGGRSRHGRVMAPKFGFFHMIASFLEKAPATRDVVVVPLSIDYDKVLEVPDYVSQLLGTPKQKESIWNLCKSIVALLFNRCGFCYVRLGTPLSMRATPSLDALAHRVVGEMQAAGTLTSTCLVAAVLLADRHRPVALAALCTRVRWLRDTLLARGATVAPFPSVEDLVAHALRLLDVAPGTLLPSDPALLLRLSFYRNHLLHHFLHEMCLATVLASPSRSDALDADTALPWAVCRRLCPGSPTKLNVAQVLAAMPGVIRGTDGRYVVDAVVVDADPTLAFARSLLHPFLDSMAVVLRALQTHVAPLNEKHPGKHHRFSERQIVEWVHRETPRGGVDHGEALSTESLKVAIQALVDSHVLVAIDRELELAPDYATQTTFEAVVQRVRDLRKPRRKLWDDGSRAAPARAVWGHLALLLM
ncbi:glycerol-3-phosphate acyltransferase [Achlya hypogyna]|uniref:Glycerol-3-phosphate acyltransferase n=1 Tax=Achlya hypogyna TaxID=1202772 RepID=A0A1V9YWR3_ACHHY|nr:glycerol-3-phosphate acyltransferase [Achlya hypogyna]